MTGYQAESASALSTYRGPWPDILVSPSVRKETGPDSTVGLTGIHACGDTASTGPGLFIRPERPASGFAEAGTIVGYRSTRPVAIGSP